MSADKVGVAIEADVVRAVVRNRQGIVAIEVPWDSTRPDLAVAALRERIGDVNAIALSIGLGFLAIAKPELPPISGSAARRILQRDADRHFPIEGRIAIAASGGSDYAFATPSATLDAWVNAFRVWAPVTSVYAAPHAIMRALSANESGASNATRSFTVDAGASERGLLSFDNNRLRDVRRLPETLAAATLNGARPIPDALLKGASGKFAAALGTITTGDDSLDSMLLDSTLEHSLLRQRQLRLWRSVAMFAASLCALVWAANMQRDKALASVEQSIRALDTQAAPAYESQAKLTRANTELALLASSQQQNADALSVLAMVSKALPVAAVVQRAEWDGRVWRIDGSTDNAAQIVPRLDSVKAFRDVHSLGASTRFRDGERMRESFSVSFALNATTPGGARDSR